MSLKNKLNRLKPHLSVGGPSEKMHTPPQAANIEVPLKDKWEEANVYPYFLDDGYCLVRELKYPLSHRHGHYCFRDFLTAVEIWNKQPINHPLSAKGHQAEELFFFDTETTGLGGGVGNTIFLLGYASVSGDSLILRQHILPHPGAEVPLYQSFLEKVNYKTLVTYNGKSFDWPQVKTRHTLVREHVPQLPQFGHFDLFHAARRLWKHKLERLKLAVVEKEVLGVERVDDIPGFLAPMIYFDFIESKQPDGMLGILKHNEIDILSLVTLYTHITFQLCGIDIDQTRPESFEVGRWFASLGEKNQAEKVLSKLINGSDRTSYQAKLSLAFQRKKEHDWVNAEKLFSDVADSGENLLMIEACLEQAKIFEHRLKDYELAIKYCQKAIMIVSQSEQTPKNTGPCTLEQLQFRLARLERKRAKFLEK
ncbi:ribonuclease H-like domain-containing protein [Bacillus sp. sid0103]|uniref:ribonuclease H-like domain-containing protein n=1 Tax=Bacillus sp. sid0103 TaxID=2856337 RepID=UPI001C4851A8|nr:ribonuclease H-like domain-containing protein [Bacillus sp. sid0103]MBV7507993.1 ribonuclease H-like domain-containing protein [Bacillus sp. sid0103]